MKWWLFPAKIIFMLNRNRILHKFKKQVDTLLLAPPCGHTRLCHGGEDLRSCRKLSVKVVRMEKNCPLVILQSNDPSTMFPPRRFPVVFALTSAEQMEQVALRAENQPQSSISAGWDRAEGESDPAEAPRPPGAATTAAQGTCAPSAGGPEVNADPGAELRTHAYARTHCPFFKLIHQCKVVCVCVSPLTSQMRCVRCCLGNRPICDSLKGLVPSAVSLAPSALALLTGSCSRALTRLRHTVNPRRPCSNVCSLSRVVSGLWLNSRDAFG